MNALNGQLALLRDRIITADPQAIIHQPEPGVWSPIQVCMHLYLAEELSLKNAKYNIGRLESREKIGLKAKINSLALTAVLASPLKFKSPPATRYDDQFESLEAQEVFENWFVLRREIIQFIQASPANAFDCQIYKHPYAGYLSIGQMISFFKHHYHHHLKQIDSRLKNWERS